MQKQQNCFIVLEVLVYGSYQPIFRDDDGLMIFPSAHQAREEIKEVVKETRKAVRKGNMENAMQMNDYEIVPATIINPDARPENQKIICFFDYDQYEMLRTDDDWHKVSITVK